MKNANSTWLLGRPLKTDLERALGRDVRIANDANCLAVSEATDGAAAGADVVFGVIVGTGTGAGITVGGRVLTGMRRYGIDDWRTNVAQGGRAEPIILNAEETRLALAAAGAVGAPVAGVDLLPCPGGGYVVLEVNAVPGWRALAATTGIDVASEMVRFIATD